MSNLIFICFISIMSAHVVIAKESKFDPSFNKIRIGNEMKTLKNSPDPLPDPNIGHLFMLTVDHRDIERLHSVISLDVVDVYRSRHQFQEALDLVNILLTQELTSYERGWALWKKATILPYLQKEGSNEASEILEDLLCSYVPHDETDETKIFTAAILYEKSKILSKAGRHDDAINLLKEAIQLAKTAHYALGNKTFYIEQMSLRMGRYLFLANRSKDAFDAYNTSISNFKSLLNEPCSNDLQRHIHCDLSVIHKELIDVYLSEGDLESAIASCKAAIDHGLQNNVDYPDHPWILSLKKRLETLEEQCLESDISIKRGLLDLPLKRKDCASLFCTKVKKYG